MTCETCHFVRFYRRDDERTVCCQRFPPVRVAGVNLAIFPAVDEGDWCGEYKANERDAPKPKRSE